jgi:hypothetical protein
VETVVVATAAAPSLAALAVSVLLAVEAETGRRACVPARFDRSFRVLDLTNDRPAATRGAAAMTATVRWTDDSGTRDETFLLSTRF